MKVSSLKIVMGVFITLMAMFLISGCGQNTAKNNNKTVSVSVATAKEDLVPVTVEAVGTVQSTNSVTVIPQVTGRITAIYYEPGQDVSEGQVLAQIDPAPFQQQVNQAQGQLNAAKAQGGYSDNTLARYKALYEQGAVSKQELEQYTSTAGEQAGTISQLEAALQSAQINLNHTQITAPISGKAGAIGANVGTMVTANQTQMVVINQMNPIYVQFTVPETVLLKITEVQAKQPISVTVNNPEDKRELGKGQVTFIDNSIDRSSGSIGLKATFDNSSQRLWPGQFLNVVLLLGEPQKAIVVPASAVMDGQQGKYVFVVQGDNTVKMQPVTVDRTVNNYSVITKGISIDDKVVTDGQLNLKDGSSISVKPAVESN